MTMYTMPGAMRVYEIAKQVGLPSKQVIEYLRGLGLTVPSASTLIEGALAEIALERLGAERVVTALPTEVFVHGAAVDYRGTMESLHGRAYVLTTRESVSGQPMLVLVSATAEPGQIFTCRATSVEFVASASEAESFCKHEAVHEVLAAHGREGHFYF